MVRIWLFAGCIRAYNMANCQYQHAMTATHLTAISNTSYQRLPIQALWQMRIAALFWVLLLTAIIVAVLGLVFPIFILSSGEANPALAHALAPSRIALPIFIILLALYWLLTGIQYRFTGYALGDDGFAIRQGMLWRRETFVLRSRVQHIDIARSPLARALGLAKLQVYTAGTKLGSIGLNGLSLPAAEAIRDELITDVSDTL